MGKTKQPFWEAVAGLSEQDLLRTGEEMELPVLPEVKVKKNRDFKPETEKIKKEEEPADAKAMAGKEEHDWLKAEGKLAIDVYQRGETSIVINSTIAGVAADDLDVIINQDMVTIRGERKKKEGINSKNYLYQECFWGKFSRSIILPFEVATKLARASIKNGILTLTLQKKEKDEPLINIEDKE